jgi:hypothetical protein
VVGGEASKEIKGGEGQKNIKVTITLEQTESVSKNQKKNLYGLACKL